MTEYVGWLDELVRQEDEWCLKELAKYGNVKIDLRRELSPPYVLPAPRRLNPAAARRELLELARTPSPLLALPRTQRPRTSPIACARGW